MATSSFIFNYGGDSFRFFPSTLVFWPEARIVLPLDEREKPLLHTTIDQYLNYARSIGYEFEADPTPDQIKDCLHEKGIKSGTLLEAIECIRGYPDTATSKRCMSALQDWCLVERYLRMEPKALVSEIHRTAQVHSN